METIQCYQLSFPSSSIQVKFEFAEASSCIWTWHRFSNPSPLSETAAMCTNSLLPPLPPLSKDQLSRAASELHLENHPPICSQFIYCPSEEDVGHQLLVQCTPGSASGELGDPILVASQPVVHLPPTTPTPRRHLHTPSFLPAPSQFRVLTYNTLADSYAASTHARQHLYPYCPPHALELDYRQCLTVHELLGYHADLMHLQEVGSRPFAQFLQPALAENGYRGVFCEKAREVC